MAGMNLADRLSVPDGTEALLLDMDGVLLDTLAADLEFVNRLVKCHFGDEVRVPRSAVLAYFPYPIPDFWPLVLAQVGVEAPAELVEKLVMEHENARRTTVMPVHEGIPEILDAASGAGLAVAVVSNNPTAEIEAMLSMAGLRDQVGVVVGTDAPGVAPKPAPDPYLAAARRLGRPPRRCVAVEDSLLGARSAAAAGCHTVAVATGAVPFADFEASPAVARSYTGFGTGQVLLGDRGVTEKSLVTPNDFVSHMIEHIAWRLGCSVQVHWTSDDWHELGVRLGRQVAALPTHRDAAAALGMIDDGSAEVAVRAAEPGTATLAATRQVDLDWFLGLRCEQLRTGEPLVRLLAGLAAGAGIDLRVTVASLEDPHHTWEGVFRAVGIALAGRCRRPAAQPADEEAAQQPPAGQRSGVEPAVEPGVVPPPPGISPAAAPGGRLPADRSPAGPQPGVERGWAVEALTTGHARLSRRTAESAVAVEVALGGPAAVCRFDVADSISVAGLADLLLEFATGAGLALEVDFLATKLSSSHVVAEDVGLVLGRAIRAVAVQRMEQFGIDGAGSNVDTISDLAELPVRVGISMEGRKFWKYVPFAEDYVQFRRSFLVGHTLPGGLFSEDLDDFVDGLAGGLQASVIVHLPRPVPPASGWPALFHGLGVAVAGLLRPNPARRGLIPGVKATLA